MEKMILSLKNIYMTLMTEDFPIYSESVIGRAERKGQTMLRFWQEQIVPEFRCLPCGKMIWRNDGKRNRYTSYLCNRSAEIKTYSEYAGELASQICVSALINQIDRFGELLSNRKYRHDILLRRIQELMRLAKRDDPRLTNEIEEQIIRAASRQSNSTRENLFQASYLLTLLMLYAAAGEAMDDPVMAVLRQKEYSLETLWNAYTQPAEQEGAAVTFLTVHSGLLQDNPLPPHRFFGREEELFNLKELAVTNQKCLITGMGGIGKTELLRQLICRCVDEKAVNQIAVVPYENSIAESFLRAFPGFWRQKPEDAFQMILHQLRKAGKQGKTLLLIDNLTNSVQEDPDLEQLRLLDCAVLITTRRNTLEGFEAYNLDNPTARTGALIFRDNYGSLLNSEDLAVLKRMLAEETLCHPLTLRLMARAARGRKWSVEELEKRLRQNGLSFSWQEEEQEVDMKRLYRQLYSYMQLPEEYHTLAELFTLLPRDSYAASFLCRYFPDITGPEAELRTKLNAMCEGGWLEAEEDGWSMHPLIAQCLRRRSIPAERVAPMLRTIQQNLDQQGGFDPLGKVEPELWRVCGIVVYTGELLTGSISRDLMKTILQASGRIVINRNNGSYLRMLERWMKRCQTPDDEIRILYHTVQGCWHGGIPSEFLAVYEQQKQKPTVSGELMRGFCYFAGESLIYQQEYALAETILKEELCDDADVTQKAATYYMLAVCAELRGNAEAFLYWTNQGADYIKRHPECREDVAFFVNCAACGAYIKFGMQDAACPLMAWLSERIGSQTDPDDLLQYSLTAGNYELYFGAPEKALEHFQKARSMRERFRQDDPSLIQLMGQIAITLQRLGRYQEALDTYLTILEHVRENGSDQLLHLVSNNIAVVYLELGQPLEALPHLETAMIQARQSGGIALAEVQRNRARAFGLLGEREEEYTCLKEAAPLLEEAYGTQHPRAQAARHRLDELEKERTAL